MKLKDLRAKLRRPAPVDELDQFLIEKGTMKPPPAEKYDAGSTPIKGRRHDLVVFDDPIADSLPPSIGAVAFSPHANDIIGSDRPGFVGAYVYNLKRDELCQIKQAFSHMEAGREVIDAFDVWEGERDDSRGNTEILWRVNAGDLYPMKHKMCGSCARGDDRRFGGYRAALAPCKQCNGLGRVPTMEGLAPFTEYKKSRYRP